MRLEISRRAWSAAAISAAVAWSPCVSPSARAESVVSRGVPELNNAIIASRDTNISPKEIYDFLWDKRDEIGPKSILGAGRDVGQGHCLDLGAGAGVSTRTLWEMGWADVVAVDPSRLAWDRFTAGAKLPDGITFLHASDEEFLRLRAKAATAGRVDNGPTAAERRFDLVVVNYAINHDKAERFARELLTSNGRLLAPTNVQNDYWFVRRRLPLAPMWRPSPPDDVSLSPCQTPAHSFAAAVRGAQNQQYEFMDAQGRVFWTKGRLWSYDVLFQPDFTSQSCQGQWCPNNRIDDAARDLVL